MNKELNGRVALTENTRQDLIAYMETEAYRPMTVSELVGEFQIEGSDGFREFVKLLNRMEEAGDVVRTRTDRYGVPERMNLVVGRLQMKARGYGFLIPETPGETDLYIASADMNGALSGDKVIGRVEKVGSGPRREGKVIRVLERATNRVVGRFTLHRDHGFVSPADKRFPQDIFVSREDIAEDAHDGYMVVVEITEYPTATRGPEGKIVEVLGHPDAPGIDILAVVRKYELPEVFPDKVLEHVETIPFELSAADLVGRRDLREEVIVTIDGEDAKDLDDAVHVKRLANGHYVLGVHIADVGYYVKEGDVLDKEALRRGTSVYLVDRVIPMLPQRLSNYICSLNPHVDRVTLSCLMEFDTNGEVVHHEIFPSLIKTAERMTYSNVRKLLEEDDADLRSRYASLIPHFERMRELALILRERRMRRGAIDFDFDEVKVIVDELGHPSDIVPRQRSIAERIIEEFMLAANETVAEHFHWLNAPFVYRIHEDPDMDRIMDFNEFLHNFGYHVKGVGTKVHPRAFQDVLNQVKGAREERMISTLMLRSMRQARYGPECVGHFGLAAEYYAHFTSPIRRYPDLMIHRIIRECLAGPLSEQRDARLRELVYEASVQSSERERVAQDAERECDQLKMVEFMLDHIGEEYDGLISGVTQFGLFVQLQNGVEGLIHVSYLTDDYYFYHEKQLALIGERTRRVFRMGDPVRVKVANANKAELTIDFELIAHRREATFVAGVGATSDTVVYDEDLSPGERTARIADREARAQGPSAGGRYGRGSRDGRDGSGSREGRSNGRARSGARSGVRGGVDREGATRDGEGKGSGRRNAGDARSGKMGAGKRRGNRLEGERTAPSSQPRSDSRAPLSGGYAMWPENSFAGRTTDGNEDGSPSTGRRVGGDGSGGERKSRDGASSRGRVGAARKGAPGSRAKRGGRTGSGKSTPPNGTRVGFADELTPNPAARSGKRKRRGSGTGATGSAKGGVKAARKPGNKK